MSEVKIAPMTLAQMRVYDFIVDFLRRNEYSPSIAEIADGLGYSSGNCAYEHVRALARKGWIKKTIGRTRNIVICAAEKEKPHTERDFLRAEVERLRKDSERLDWMIKEIAVVHDLIGQSGPSYCIYWPDLKEEQISTHETPRAAIDAAMEAGQ